MFYTYVGKKGNHIHHIGYKNGKKFHEKESFEPSIYYEINSEEESSGIDGTPLRKRTFETISEWYKFVNQNRDMINLYGNIDPAYQYIAANYKKNIDYKQTDIRIWQLDIEVLSEEGFPYPHEAKWPIVSIAIYDTKRNEYLVICLKGYEYDTTRLKLNTNKVQIKVVDTEKELINTFVKLNSSLKPDIWIAHNGDGFDFPYIINRMNVLKMDSNDLSPIGKVSYKYTEIEDKFMSNKGEYYTSIDGISLLDNMKLYKKYVADPRESYSLSNLAVEDLGMDKLNYEEYDNLGHLYQKDHTKFIDYNITDVYLMFLLNQKRKYIDIHIRNTYKAKAANFEDCMSPVKLWDIYIYQTLQQMNIQIPPTKTDTTKFSYPGAYVVDPIIALHKWVIPFDITSLYPHIQMQWNISPEKLVEDLTVDQWLQSLTDQEIDQFIEKSNNPEQIKFLNSLKEMNSFGYAINPINRNELDERVLKRLIPTHPDYIMSANGFYFKKDELGCIPNLLIENYNERKAIKKEMAILETKQDSSLQDTLAGMKVAEQGIKIMINAEYGALANEFFRYCKYELCSSITMNGQLIIRSLINNITKKLPEIIIVAGDTDSCYFGFENLVRKNCKGFVEAEIIEWINQYCKDFLQPTINETFAELAEYVGAPKNYIKMVREKILSDAFWVAKKHYAYRMVVKDDIVLKEPQFGYKGMSAIKSSTAKGIRNLLKKSIQVILTDPTNIIDNINKSKEAIFNMTPEEIAFPKTCNGLYKYSDGKGGWIKGAQAHVKAAIVYNQYVLNHKLIDQYPIIQEGEKIRFVWLKSPNPFNSEVFGFLNRLPKDEMIQSLIDYETIYEKAFHKPLLEILERLNLSNCVSKTSNLDDFF